MKVTFCLKAYLLFEKYYQTQDRESKCNNIWQQWRSKEGGASGGTCPGVQALGAQQHTFSVILNVFLSRNLDKVCLKMRLLGKNCKNRLGIGGYAPEPPFASGGWRQNHRVVTPVYYYNFVEFVSSAKCILFRSKTKQVNTASKLSFVEEGDTRIFLAPGRRVP